MIELRRYQLEDNSSPVTDWLRDLRDMQARAQIEVRFRRVSTGNFGDCKAVGEGVSELRVDIGSGYRLYYGKHGQALVILLWGRRQTFAAARHCAGQSVLGGLEKEKFMKKASIGSVSHTEETIKELRADRQFAVAYLKSALEELDDPNNRAAGLLALRDVAEAYGGLGAVAEQAGISREALYRSLSPKGNPTLKTLLAVLKTVGMRLSVEPENRVLA